MASSRIVVDQENRPPGPDARRVKGKGPAAAPIVRAPLLPNNTLRNKANCRPQTAATGLKNVVVPVAQFEAFKVYEDDEEMAKIDRKLRQISRCNVYKGTAEDRFLTKAEAEAIQRQKKYEEEEKKHPTSSGDDEEVCTPVLIKSPTKKNATLPGPEAAAASEAAAPNTISRSKSGIDMFFELDQYRDEIFVYLREHELKHRPKSGYIQKQPDVTDNMRAIMIDWLVEVAEEYHLQTETLYLAVNYIDRFLSYMSVVRAKLQLVGTAAMFLAAKYEEIFPPDVSEFVYITDDTYDKNQVTRMEHLILRVLGFDLSTPTPLTFLTVICVAAKLSDKVLYLAMYLSELALLKVEPYLEFLPSMVACAAIALAQHTLGSDEPWSRPLYQYTGYTLAQLQKPVNFMQEIFHEAPSLSQHAIQDKYKSTKLLEVSNIQPRDQMILFD